VDDAKTAGLKSGDPGRDWRGVAGKTLRESTPWWAPRTQAPDAAPNIVIILLDDLGFSDLGCFGSEIDTPHIDALASSGLRLTHYTTVPMCTPARAALLSGKNPHSVGCGWLTFNSPGFPGYGAGEMSLDAPIIPELLRAQGYSTYAVGKWHNTAEFNITPAGDRGSWPLQRGFDRFYGFIGGEAHYFAPAQLFEDNAILDLEAYPPDYYCTDDWTDKALHWLKAHRAAAPDKPFFLYLAHNAPHAPLHAKADDLQRQAGRYAAGWDAARQARLQRQIESGLMPESIRLAPRSQGVPPWDSLPKEQQLQLARYMELYAGIVQNIDWNVGRVTEFLRSEGILDNTLILLTSDNGANGIGGLDGAVNNLSKRLTKSEDPDMVARVMQSGSLGNHTTWPTYPLGWTDVSSTPFRMFKTTTMNGGIRVPLLMHWPKGLPAGSGLRHQWVHVTDILPTLLEMIGASYPSAFNGYRTRGLDGQSFLGVLRDESAKRPQRGQHYELAGNRGYILGRWKIVSLQPPGAAINLDNWMLFDLEADPTETTDLAKLEPKVLADLVAAFETDAAANYVYPLDNRDIRRALAVPPFLEKNLSLPRTFYPGGGTIPLPIVGPMLADRDFELHCTFEYGGSEAGVLFAVGDPIAGMALYIRDARLHFEYHGGTGVRPVVAPMSPRLGENHFKLTHQAQGKRQGVGRIELNGATAESRVDMSPTLILGWVGEGLDIGRDTKQRVSEAYGQAGTCSYSGKVDHVHIAPGPHPADSYANRPERESQLD
jgi:arylsulfatase